MLYRNDLTLSAHSNRLNLGTRSLVLTTGVNNGGADLCIRATNHPLMRAFMAEPSATSFSPEVCAVPPITVPVSWPWACAKACAKASKPVDADASRVPFQLWRSWRSCWQSSASSGQGLSRSSRSRRSVGERRSAARVAS